MDSLRIAITRLMLAFSGILFLAVPQAHAVFGECPPIGYSVGCSLLIEIRPDGSLKFLKDPTILPYDNVEDTLVGVVNHSGATVFGISLGGAGIFDFDGDGAGDPTGSFWAADSPFGAFPGGPFGPTTYEGPHVSFDRKDINTGTVKFNNGLNNGGSLWFSLEGAPSQIRLTSSITIDPGHGSNCALIKQPVGAVGKTDYPASNPPAGKLKEDVLTVQISLALKALLDAAGYDVTMTKSDSVSCPTYLERTTKANKAKSNMFVSVHVNQPNPVPLFPSICGTGTSALYNSAKTSSKKLAQLLVSSVSAGVGTGILLTTKLCLGTDNVNVNGDGTYVRDGLAVLKTTGTRMTAVMIETARLSSPDEDIVHNPSFTGNAAQGIFSGIDAFVNQ